MAPTTARDAVAAPKIETALTIILGVDYFQQVEESGEGNDGKILAFMLETRHKAFDWIVNQDPIQLEYNSPNLVQRFLLVLFYYQTTRHQRWKECNPPATPQGSAFCYEPDIVTGEATSTIWGDQWLSASHECQWAGVACETVQSKEMTVARLRIRWNQLNGPLPWEISQLPHLKRLHLHGNMLSGMLPPKLLSFSLESLRLGNNQLSGPIPAGWFEIRHDGTTIPSEVGMPPLKTLHLGNNSLTGSLPLDLFHLGSLGSLFVDQNDLTGTLPSEIGLLTHLQLIFLSHTGIGGTLPSEIGLATQLTEFRAAYSNMEGTLPEEMYTGLTDLIAFVGNDCNFSGTISPLLGRLTGLQWLGLANNNFDGTIPNEIESLTDLGRLEVNGNQFTGAVPVSVCQNLAYFTGDVAVVADCLPNPGTGVPTIECGDDCCTSCCDNTGVCLAN
ncbi:LRR receptor-like serine threonine-protein kinase At4g08850-like [Seminavis robusta]|uniref:LRR receptor-like serine threonine-protein kinase At4g08850-like n=1 Tax=Seminavis robusta TaxID=568900 RepID=A0A9N8EC07_9STRA|nr:LRR receptor-like serine threonine-protein kinase At4g08850-like [Seminavis robusta]|eukprot:Sro949_g223650.1 LRR receptor-like serine threonine-protein kinase At4g08850-like (445) ;mRNA; f:15824-17319